VLGVAIINLSSLVPNYAGFIIPIAYGFSAIGPVIIIPSLTNFISSAHGPKGFYMGMMYLTMSYAVLASSSIASWGSQQYNLDHVESYQTLFLLVVLIGVLGIILFNLGKRRMGT